MPGPDSKKARTLRSDLRLPARCKDFSSLDVFNHWYVNLWQMSGIPAEIDSPGLLRTYVSMVTDGGLPPTAAIDCICAYWRNPGSGNDSISISAQRFVEDGRRSTISFNRMTSLAIDSWRNNSEWRRAITYQMAPRPTRLAKLVTAKLKKSFRSTIRCEPEYSVLRFSDIVTLGHVIAQSQGIEPYLISALAGKTRPTDYIDGTYGLSNVSREAFSHMPIKSAGLTLRSVHPRAATEPRDAESELDIPPTWIADAKALLRDLCRELDDSISQHVNTQGKQRKARRIFSNFRIQAQSFSPDDSILCLAIKYAERRFVDGGKIKANTLRAYLDRAVICGFLNSEESYHMTDWDSDDLVESLEDRLSEPRLSKRSKGLILTAYAPLLRFLTAELGVSPVSIKGIRIDYVTGAGRWQLVSPHAIDKVISRLSRDPDRRLRQAGLVVALGYYGGLRTGDIKNLTLADVVFNDRLCDLDIEICRGKSRNTRRRLPFHALAPSHIQSQIREFSVDRLSEFPNRKILSKIPLLGPESCIESYDFASIARLARFVLKQAFGADTNIHTLRHCFCSNLMIRWYSIRHPDMLQDLRDASHEIYQPGLQDQLDRFFSVMPQEDGEIRPHDLISMIKLTGHANPETLFQYYVHTFGVIQSHAMRSCHSLIENIEVRASDIALLLPRMKSSKSRTNIANKTLGGLADYLLEQGPTGAEFTSVLPDTQLEMPN